ncbi:MAG: hypothetical protein Q9174_000176 [Haloplaca sp. 1 TL-2023]
MSKSSSRRTPQERYVEELDSDDDDGQGVTLDRSYHDGHLFLDSDVGHFTQDRRLHTFDDDTPSSDEGRALERRSPGTMQLALRNKEDLLVEQALERIRRAQMLGKQNVKLSKPEIGALERKRRQDEAKRASVGSDVKQADRRRSSGQLKVVAKETKPGKRRSGGPGTVPDRAYPSDGRTATPPGAFTAPRPNGRPVQSPPGHRAVSSIRDSRSGSRSGSSASLQQTTPPLPSNQYWSPQPRYPPEAGHGPPFPAFRNSPVPRRLPDDPHWDPRPRSSSSNHPYSQEAQYSHPYPSPPFPTSSQYFQGRRIVSGPAEMRYPIIRRPVPLSPSQATSTHPNMGPPSGDSFRDDNVSEDGSDDDDEDYGVQVDVRDYDHGYEVRRGPDPRSSMRPRKPPR